MPRAAGGRRGLTRAAVTFLAIALALVLAPASAYWTSSGSGTTTTTTGTLRSPVNVTVPASAISTVAVSWDPGSGGVTPQGYYLTRHVAASANSPATTDPACASSPTVLLPGPGCADTGVPDGDYTYVVTAVFATWTAPSSSSNLVTVTNPAALAFTTEPSDTTAAETMTPPVTVALRTAGDAPIAVAGIPVTLTLGTNPSSGVLGGTTTLDTDATGQVSFPGLSINQPGVGYTLVATSPGLADATSAAFTVTAPPLLRTAGTYSVLAGTAVTSTGLTTVSGDVGVNPGLAVTGLSPLVVGGDIHIGDAAAAQAQVDRQRAYNELAALQVTSPGGELVGGALGGRTLGPGVYHSVAAWDLTGDVTLDAGGDPNAVFVFQTDAAFNTAAGADVVLLGGAKASNIYWLVTAATNTGAGSTISGTILSQQAITLGAGTVLIGRALSATAVTLDASTIRFTTDPPPSMLITGGPTVATQDQTPTISGTTTAGSTSPVTVTITDQRASTTVRLSTTVAPDGTWSVTAATMAAGVYDVVAKVRAPGGDGAAATQALTVEVNPEPVNLGSAATFSVLGSTSVASAGTTSLSGDLGVSPSPTLTGFGASEGGTAAGATHVADTVAATARTDLVAALDEASLRPAHTEIVGNLAGRTFHVGVHHSTTALALTGTVILDGQGDPDAVFIFQSAAAFDTAASSTVVLTGGTQAKNVFWVVTGAANTAAGTSMAGSILARGAITLGDATILAGQALSLDAVTLTASKLTGVTPAGTP